MFYCREEELRIMNQRYEKGGFTQGLQELGRQGAVTLLSLEDLYDRKTEQKHDA